MTAVSSFRPLKDCSPEILVNQLRAANSWRDAFDRIVYFGPHQKALDGPHVTFLNSEQFPCIRTMAVVASQQRGWTAIVNADIVIAPDRMWRVQDKLNKEQALCCMSRRLNFMREDMKDGVMDDLGLDFFAAQPHVWARVAKEIPDQFRIGHQQWDTWLLGFFCANYGQRVVDITPWRMVYHPRHEDRQRPHPINPKIGEDYFSKVRWPRLLLP